MKPIAYSIDEAKEYLTGKKSSGKDSKGSGRYTKAKSKKSPVDVEDEDKKMDGEDKPSPNSSYRKMA